MKTQLVTIIALLAVLLAGCKAVESVSKEERAIRITQKVESGNFEFIAEKAPMRDGFHSLGSSYFVRVSKEIIEVDLPFFGRVYGNSIATAGEGIKFTSLDFEYLYSENENGSWNASVDINDNQKRYRIFITIEKNGYAALSVHDVKRQANSFYGIIDYK